MIHIVKSTVVVLQENHMNYLYIPLPQKKIRFPKHSNTYVPKHVSNLPTEAR
jgi:hypothetical protein